EVRKRLAEYDVVLVVGMDLLRLYVYHEPACPIPEHIRLIHIDADPWQLNKNYPLEVGLLGDPLATLPQLDRLIVERSTAEQAERARHRAKAHEETHRRQASALGERAARERAARPPTPLALMAELARVLPEDVAVVEEAVTTTSTYLERLGAVRN